MTDVQWEECVGHLSENRSHCHGNGCLNDDSKSHRSIPIALHMILNPADMCGGQSVHDSKSHRRTYVAGRVHVILNPVDLCCGQSAREVHIMSSHPFCIYCNMHLLLQIIPSVLIEWPPYEVGVRACRWRSETKKVYGCHRVLQLVSCWLPMTWMPLRGDGGDNFDWISEQFWINIT